MQAFHWFANPPALAEIHRVLHPHGVLGMVWNIEDYNSPQTYEASTPWEQKVRDLTWTFQDHEPRFRHEKWRQVFEEQSKSTPLSLLVASDQKFALPLGEEKERFEVWLPREEVWERYATISHIAVLEGEEREVSDSNISQGPLCATLIELSSGHARLSWTLLTTRR